MPSYLTALCTVVSVGLTIAYVWKNSRALRKAFTAWMTKDLNVIFVLGTNKLT